MAGIYIHIPFCRSRCIYCGFYSTTSLALRQRYVDAVCCELRNHRDWPTSTIYLGGGTPSQLTITQLRQIFDVLYKYNKVETDAEVTIEVNPDDVTPDFASALAHLPVNRVSMGAQTFDDDRLRFLHRRHTAEQISSAVTLLRNAGIHNLSIDLMYGFPGESLADWDRDITAALALNVEHLSAYCLMIEEGTPLWRMVSSQRDSQGDWHKCAISDGTEVPVPMTVDEELERQMYDRLIDRLTADGYEHYELSNFARPGYRSRHNSSYWNGTPYIGIGAAAHSYNLSNRSWNISDLQSYINGIENGESVSESEPIDEDTRYNDLITVALRTCEGLDLSTLSDRHRDYCIKNARRFIDSGLLRLHNNHLILTRAGLFVSDMIMSELIFLP